MGERRCSHDSKDLQRHLPGTCVARFQAVYVARQDYTPLDGIPSDRTSGPANLLTRRPDWTKLDWEDRLVPFDLVVEFPPLPVEQPGSLDVIVPANGRQVRRQQLRIRQEERDDHDDRR